MKIKLCGLTREADILAVNEIGPDYVGFVFAPSRRQVTPARAAALKALLRPDIPAVGVFVNQEADIYPLAEAGVIEAVQLHGDETAEEIARVRARTGLPVIRAVSVRTGADIAAAQSLPCDFLLLDTYQKDQRGGSGITFDWSLIPSGGKPFFLAGGLTIENLPRAARTGAYCLDVSSGGETDGKKDPAKMEALVRLAHNR